ncbi:serine hydrolase [Amycolatopsis saalfeldensis]|uniref:Beta-lactamase enzyme family protein n=1 Tax=Amycolatopsis saalfeldensis TaxID=394193 RepID=A0A1H8QD37_9PSEU|nr:serine hydrolase [Amycolatopsis saalfeldensis]SEO52155.1 Beta-lactamase enzyme family protein [Amycolatopsis saalfeldensis]
MIEKTAASATAGEQLDWLVAASTRAPLPDNEIRQRIAPSLVDGSGGPDGINAALAGVGPLTVHSILATRRDQAQAAVRGRAGDYLLTVHVDAAGLVHDLRLTPDEAKPASWTEIDTQLAGLGTRVSFAAAEIDPDGRCRIVHGVDAETRRPIGSAFKLYVLGALAQAVAEGRASWDEPLAIRDEWKSLPSGTMQNRPAGASFPLSEFADLMISISDNTATDHLIHRLGRDAVQRQVSLFGHRQPRANVPFLTTKAFFRLKAASETARAQYLALHQQDERAAAVLELERLPLPDVRETWPQPRDIDQIEWFASPADICRAYAGLLRLDQPGVHHALSRNDDGLNLDVSQFPAVWYKGGSEPGVVTLHYLARTADGRALGASFMASDPIAAPDTITLTAKAQSVIRGMFHLLARPE